MLTKFDFNFQKYLLYLILLIEKKSKKMFIIAPFTTSIECYRSKSNGKVFNMPSDSISYKYTKTALAQRNFYSAKDKESIKKKLFTKIMKMLTFKGFFLN